MQTKNTQHSRKIIDCILEDMVTPHQLQWIRFLRIFLLCKRWRRFESLTKHHADEYGKQPDAVVQVKLILPSSPQQTASANDEATRSSSAKLASSSDATHLMGQTPQHEHNRMSCLNHYQYVQKPVLLLTIKLHEIRWPMTMRFQPLPTGSSKKSTIQRTIQLSLIVTICMWPWWANLMLRKCIRTLKFTFEITFIFGVVSCNVRIQVGLFLPTLASTSSMA